MRPVCEPLLHHYVLSAVCARSAIQAFSMAITNKINVTAMSTNRAKVCIYLLSRLRCFGAVVIAQGLIVHPPNR
jgi:hypothetical protein